jgi:hypothetical protein
MATMGISPALKRGRVTKKDNKDEDSKKRWRQEQFKTPDVLPAQFESGIADFISAWFMNRQVVSDSLHHH